MGFFVVGMTQNSNVSFVGAAVALYRLGVLVLRDERVARRAAYLFCIAPSSIFMSAIYSERCAPLVVDTLDAFLMKVDGQPHVLSQFCWNVLPGEGRCNQRYLHEVIDLESGSLSHSLWTCVGYAFERHSAFVYVDLSLSLGSPSTWFTHLSIHSLQCTLRGTGCVYRHPR